MLNVETEPTKINILSSPLLIFPCVSTDYMLDINYIVSIFEINDNLSFITILTNHFFHNEGKVIIVSIYIYIYIYILEFNFTF